MRDKLLRRYLGVKEEYGCVHHDGEDKGTLIELCDRIITLEKILKVEKKGTYKATFVCKNCGQYLHNVEVPYGTLARDSNFIKTAKCGNCKIIGSFEYIYTHKDVLDD